MNNTDGLPGRVVLIGAGPGDPGLITVRGKDRLSQADVIVYDALANPHLLEYARPDAKLIDAGKRSRQHTLTQDQTQALLVDLAREHRMVVRLKGGDPYLFGRGAEEATYLAKRGIVCEVVPGVTSGIAAPAMAGVPVTHRAIASTVTFITGHEDPLKEESAVDYPALAGLAKTGGTLCFYMGVGRLPQITATLIRHGLSSDTPLAIVQWGTHPKQRSLRTTLEKAAVDLAASGLGAPAMIVIGQVAGMNEPGLDYFTSRKLFSQRVVVTRSRHQASALRELLEEQGASVLEAPTIALTPPASWQEVDQTIQDIRAYDWLVLSSINAVNTLATRLAVLGLDARQLAGVKIAAIGGPTAAALRDQTGLKADLLPERAIGESLAKAIIAADPNIQGKAVLYLRADISRPVLPATLKDAGAIVTSVTAYESRSTGALPQTVIDAFVNHEVDWVTFTSASTAKHLATLLAKAGVDRQVMARMKIASMGPITTQAVRDAGWQVTTEASVATLQELVDAMGQVQTSR